MQARDAAVSILPSPSSTGIDLHKVRAQRISDRPTRTVDAPARTATSESTTPAAMTSIATALASPTAHASIDSSAAPRLELLLRERLGPEKLGRYLRGGRALELTGDSEVTVSVSSPMVAAIVEKDFANIIRAAAGEVLACSTVTLRVKLVPNIAPTTSSAAALTRAQPLNSPPGSRIHANRARALVQPMRYRMSDVVQGPFNRLAAESARRHALNESGCSMLVVHAGVGMGKTHLLHALASEAALREPGQSIVVTTAEQFVNEFVMACKLKQMDDFRRKFRRADLLCIDDVQSLVGKTATQQELVATIDSVQQRRGRVALTSDRQPRHIAGLNDALASRLSSGLVVGIATLDHESIGRVISALSTRRTLMLEDEALTLLTHAATATRTPERPAPSIRDLEGLVTKVEAVHRLLSGAGSPSSPMGHATGRVGVLSARQALGQAASSLLTDRGSHASSSTGSRRDSGPRALQMSDIVRVVCGRLSIDAQELANKHRHPRVVLARSLCTHLARATIGMSYPEIARSLGRPNHSTVLTAHQRIRRQIESGEIVGGIAEPVRELAESLLRELSPRTASAVIATTSR